jgi:pentatricopeptide repeat protein
MMEQGMRPSDYTYSSMVAAYSLAGDMEGALRVRRRMRQAGCPPSVHVFNALLAACERVHAFEVALELLQAMRREVSCDAKRCCT